MLTNCLGLLIVSRHDLVRNLAATKLVMLETPSRITFFGFNSLSRAPVLYQIENTYHESRGNLTIHPVTASHRLQVQGRIF